MKISTKILQRNYDNRMVRTHFREDRAGVVRTVLPHHKLCRQANDNLSISELLNSQLLKLCNYDMIINEKGCYVCSIWF